MIILDCYKQFPDEESCTFKFKTMRDREGITCSKCGYVENYQNKDKYSYEYKNGSFWTSLRLRMAMQSSKLHSSHGNITITANTRRHTFNH